MAPQASGNRRRAQMTNEGTRTTSLPVIDACGSALAIGSAIGETLRDGLRNVAEGHCVALDASIGWQRALDISRSLLPVTEETLPDCLDELRGMAAGSGVAFDVLFSMNA